MSFEDWYQAYPNKRGKDKARERWTKDKLDSQTGNLIAKLEVEKRWRKTQKQLGSFVADWPMASTYLNQRRYNDEIEDCNFGAAREAREVKTCQCGSPVMGPRFKTCQACYPERSYQEHATEKRLEEIRAHFESRYGSQESNRDKWFAYLGAIRKKHSAAIGGG